MYIIRLFQDVIVQVINFIIILYRKNVLMIKIEVKYCILNVIIMFEGDEDCIYYNNEVDKF